MAVRDGPLIIHK